MAKVIGKEQLYSTDLKYFKALQGIEGRTLFDRYPALENIVKSNIDAKYQDFLAQPVKDGDTITWHGKTYHETPLLLSDLQGEELEKYTQIKKKTLAHYNRQIDELRNSGKTKEAEFLANAIKYVDDRFVYCYADKVVLGAWGMQLRNNVREDISEIRKDLIVKRPPVPPVGKSPQPGRQPEEPFTIRFNPGSDGNLYGNPELSKYGGEYVDAMNVPAIEAKEGYEFIGWDMNPDNYYVSGNTEFTAQYRPIVPPPPPPGLPWYRRFWNWLKGLFSKGCLRWLLWLLLLLLLLLLVCWLLRRCNEDTINPVPYPIEDKPWVGDDPRSGGGGIYNPGAPYEPAPTPPGHEDVLPPNQGVMPPIDTTKIIRRPGEPVIIANRLNILMENGDKSIMALAKDFKAKYPDDKYKVIYYDDVVKRMQIEIPPQERIRLKQEIPAKFAPNYELFVFDEALFEGTYAPNDPAYSDKNKSWYLHTVKAPQAWDITRGSKNITIAIVDNGFNLKHPELHSKVVMPYNVWMHSKDVFPQQVDHGTHVAGTALAITDNGKGICGIAPNCAFMPIQVANKQGLMTTTSVLDGILYALYQGADVINCSLGTQFSGLDAFPETFQRELLHNRFKEEERLWNEIMKITDKHNATIVVAAGNDNVLAGIDPLQRPKHIITVSAVNKKSQPYAKANFSNYGDYATISAPGVDIYSTTGNSDYTTMDGTSMAAPIVSGGIALMKSLKEDLTAEQIICILQGTGVSVNGKIGNLIQLDKALQKVQSGDFSDCDSRSATPSTGDVQVLLSWNNYNYLDLACIDPKGNPVWYKNKRTPSGGQLEIDMNRDYPDSRTPIENIFWQPGTAPNGTYEIYLWLYKQHEPHINETPYTITVRYGNRTENFAGRIKKEDGRVQVCTFTLGNKSIMHKLK